MADSDGSGSRLALSLFASACALLAGPVRAGGTDGASELRWKGRVVAADELPGEFTSARLALEAWGDWAREHEYDLALDATGRVLLIAPAGASSQNKARLRLCERTVAFVDAELPFTNAAAELAQQPAAAPTEPVASGPGRALGDEIPEDPEGSEPLFGDGPRTQSAAAAASRVWGAGTRPLDTGCATMFVLRGPDDYESVLDALVAKASYLEGWARSARSINGFAIFAPLAGAMLLDAPGMEEWDPEAELCHRLATLLVARRFGQQPYWFSAGFSWHAELTLRKAIYCFPFRDEFVGVGEHGGWAGVIKRRFEDQQFDASHLSLERGSYNDSAAGVAWAVAMFLCERHSERTPEVLVRFYLAWDQGSRVELGGGQWERDRSFALSATEQMAILEDVLGAGVGEELQRFLESGCRP